MTKHGSKKNGRRVEHHRDVPMVADEPQQVFTAEQFTAGGQKPLWAQGMSIVAGQTENGMTSVVFQFQLVASPSAVLSPPIVYTGHTNADSDFDEMAALVARACFEAKELRNPEGPPPLEEPMELTPRGTCKGPCGRPIFGDRIDIGYCSECAP